MQSPATKLLLLSLAICAQSYAASIDVLFGTSHRKSVGIYHAELDTESGQLTEPTQLVEIGSPGFLTMHPDLPVLYAVARDNKQAVVQSYKVADGGAALTEFNQVDIPGGNGAHIAVHPSGKFLLTAQYGAGLVSLFPLAENGEVLAASQTVEHQNPSKVHARQDSPHPHWVGFSPDGRFALVPDLGTDTIEIYSVDLEKMVLVANGSAKSAPGSGPRHMRFSRDGKFIHLLNELTLSVSTFAYDADSGSATHVDTIPALTDEELTFAEMNTASEILVHPSGKFIYSANRGHNSVSVYSVDTATGKLARTQVESIRGDWPRNINLTPDGAWLIAGGQRSGTVSVFSVDPKSGKLSFIDGSIQEIPFVSCILFLE
ncbi:MAG: lactonase family protein [Opitutales bacterium]